MHPHCSITGTRPTPSRSRPVSRHVGNSATRTPVSPTATPACAAKLLQQPNRSPPSTFVNSSAAVMPRAPVVVSVISKRTVPALPTAPNLPPAPTRLFPARLDVTRTDLLATLTLEVVQSRSAIAEPTVANLATNLLVSKTAISAFAVKTFLHLVETNYRQVPAFLHALATRLKRVEDQAIPKSFPLLDTGTPPRCLRVIRVVTLITALPAPWLDSNTTPTT